MGARVVLWAMVGLGVACSGGKGDPDANGGTTGESDPGVDTDDSGMPAGGTLRCEYGNAFTGEPECKQYTGVDWTPETARTDCELNIPGGGGNFLQEDASCAVDPMVGRCDVDLVPGSEYFILVGGDSSDLCEGAELACTAFASGEFTAEPVCEGDYESDHTVFIWPYQECLEPVEGEPAGSGPDGDVCVWQSINGCVEEGRDFRDYGSCGVVETNRPYYPVDGRTTGGADDPRMSDAEYLAELEWVSSQVESCACICCHSEQTREGPAIWSVDGPTLWPDMMSDQAIGMFAGYVDSSALGAYPADVNNGFDRTDSAMPTTDVDRMVRFWLAEFDRRGLQPEDMEDYLPVGSTLLDQVNYELQPCEGADGMASDGTITWEDERTARYLYILEEGSANPGVPPNFDMPEGVLWRVDVAHTDDGFPSGVQYGEAPGASTQIVPEPATAAPVLTTGQTYHLYVLFDVALPIARCSFTAP